MIDVHCHLEQKEYDKDREEVIARCKKELKAVITCCAHPDDFDITMDMVRKHRGFVYASVGIHPEYIKDLDQEQIERFIGIIEQSKDDIVAIGEIGLDYYWIKEDYWREKQKELFSRLIELAKKLKMPVVIHARDAFQDAIEILEQHDAKHVCMHMFGANHLVKRIIDNGWYVSLNLILRRSKKHKKVARDMPLERLLLETDSPWLGNGRNEPLSIKEVASLIAGIKKIEFTDVWKQCGKNAIELFKLSR